MLSAALAAEVTLPSTSAVEAAVERLSEEESARWAEWSVGLGADDAADLAALLLVERPELEAAARARAEARAQQVPRLDALDQLAPTAFWDLHQRVQEELWNRLEASRVELQQRLAGRSE